jgi:preprotein translocase subunit SecF
LIAFLIVIMLFLAMTFEPKMAIAAIIAVVHDVFITVGIYALVGFDVTPATVIGFLTILGYSLYDTVVVFDKVRENTRSITSTSKQTYTQATNLAVNQTLVRSINTSVIALIPVGSILFVGAGLLGAGTLKDLSLALFIGMIVGAYSSIFIAPPVLAQLREKEPAMIALAKRVQARGSTVVNAAATSSSSAQVATATVADRRGPRNQPKRKGRK